ncbi:hypothetical protein Tco_0017534 [Tanacetum coccineum]
MLPFRCYLILGVLHKSFINAVSQARIRLRVLSRNKVTCGLELDTQFGVLKRKLSHLDVKSVIGHLENKGLGYVKFDIQRGKKERRKESYVQLMFWYEDLYKEFRLECCRKGAVVLLFMFDAVVDGSSKIQRGNEVKTKFAREGIKYEMGDWVYLKLQPYMLISVRKSHHNKFYANVYDPYQVTVERGKVACKLETLQKAKIHLVFYASQLKKDKRMQKGGGVIRLCMCWYLLNGQVEMLVLHGSALKT